MSKFTVGDKVKIIYPSTFFGKVGEVAEITIGAGGVQIVRVQLSDGDFTRWLGTSLELIEPVKSAPVGFLSSLEQELVQAAIELHEARDKFQKALDAVKAAK